MRQPPDQWLLRLCDPRGLPPDLAPCDLQDDDLTRLWRRADSHGVLPALVCNLQSNNPSACAKIERSGAAERLAQRAAVAMFLRVRAQELLDQFRVQRIPAVLIKGPLVARRLYRPASLRTYVDIDALVSRKGWEDARAVMRSLGYTFRDVTMKYDTGYGEDHWIHPEHPGCSFELHWNLVNSPTVRRGLSVTYEDLMPPPAGDPLGDSLSPAALLVIAAVHAAANHSFDKLQQLCDIAQLARGIAGDIDVIQLADMTRATGAALAIHAALRLAGQALRDQASLDLLARLHVRRRALPCRFLSPTTVLRGQDRDRLSSLRRRLFRQALKRRRP